MDAFANFERVKQLLKIVWAVFDQPINCIYIFIVHLISSYVLVEPPKCISKLYIIRCFDYFTCIFMGRISKSLPQYISINFTIFRCFIKSEYQLRGWQVNMNALYQTNDVFLANVHWIYAILTGMLWITLH